MAARSFSATLIARRNAAGHGAPFGCRSIAAAAHSTLFATPSGLASGSVRKTLTAATVRATVSRATAKARICMISVFSSGSGWWVQ